MSRTKSSRSFPAFLCNMRHATYNSQLATRNSQLTSAEPVRAGSALVIVLGMLSVLLLMGVAFSVTMRTERAGAANMRHAAIARHILDSAIVRTMADLDKALEEQGDLPVPTGGVIVTVSQQPGGKASISPLSPEAALHIPGDQLIASMFTTAQWLPIYGDVRITGTKDSDVASEDSPVGRYAFVILNGSGYLDPNVVGTSNRLYGLSPNEIVITNENKKLFGSSGKDGTDFLKTRDSIGHFATMRDFLRPAITNLLGYRPMTIKGASKQFPTNSFFIGSLALDDFAPPTGKDENDYPLRKPKFSLRDEYGDLKTVDEIKKDPAFQEAMENSFAATYKAQTISPLSNKNGYLPKNFRDQFSSNNRFAYPLLAARNLLEMMDADGHPGGSTPHSYSNIGQQGGVNADEYVEALTGKKWNWDRLPCVEPVPMLDNLIICGGYDPGLSTNPDGDKTVCLTWHEEKEKIPDPANPQNTTDGNVTGIVCTVTLTLCGSSDIYLGWNVPKDAEGKYTYNWHFTGVELDDPGYPKSFKPFVDAVNKQSFPPADRSITIELNRKQNGTPVQYRSPADFLRLPDIKFCIEVNPSVPSIAASDLPNYIPDDFGLVLHAVGVMGRGGQDDYKNDIVQVVPCQEKSIDQASGDSVLDIYLPINREEALAKDTADYVLGASYALDPRFAYKKMSWAWTPGYTENTSGMDNEPDFKLRRSLVRNTLNSLEVLQDVNNPLTDKYLRDPRQMIGGKSLIEIFNDLDPDHPPEGSSDVMRSAPEQGFYNQSTSEANAAAGNGALSFYFDPSEPDDSPWAFTRVGQLGFVPIGTHRTISLMDGFDNVDNTPHVEARQRVLDFFTMHSPRDPGSSGSASDPGDPVRTERFSSRVGINPPMFPKLNSKNEVVPGDEPNLQPLTAALNGCVLREFGSENDKKKYKVDWDTAEEMADVYADSLDRDDEGVRNVDGIDDWDDDWDDAEGVTRSLSVLGRSMHDSDAAQCVSIDAILHEKFPESCDFDREGVIRNTAEMLTTRQQLFTILLKADSFTPMSGFSDADHGMSLASVQAIAHVWRDPEPLRDADGVVILDNNDNPIHAWVLLDLYQF